MSRFRPRSVGRVGVWGALAVIAFPVALAGCGSSSKPTKAAQLRATSTATTPTTPTTTTTQTTAKHAAKKHAVAKKKTSKSGTKTATTTGTTTNKTTTTTTKTTTTPKTTPKKPTPAPGTSVDLRSTKLGMILAGPTGRTLYLFAKDTGTSSTCYGSCAAVWPPLTTKGKPQAGPGVRASLLGTSKRTDGTTEVTYAGHPLYYYAGDSSPGQTTGQALNQFGALWYVLSASGAAIKSNSSS